MTKTLVLIGGGEIRAKETLAIDRQIAALAAARAGERRANALFIGTASHDSMPYYNTFHKTYTGELGLKTDVALTVYGEMNREKLAGKFEKADMIYIGGGDTLFMLDSWRESGLLDMIREAYERGVIVSGLSAGAICWGERMFTDSAKTGEGNYAMADGLGWIGYGVCPHYESRTGDFAAALEGEATERPWLCVEGNGALLLRDGKLIGSLAGDGNSYLVRRTSAGMEKTIVGRIPDGTV